MAGATAAVRTGAATRRAPGADTGQGLFRGAAGRSVGLVLAALPLAAAIAVSILIGNYPLSAADAASALSGPIGTEADRIVWHVRVPRTATGLLTGVGLGVAGAVMQGLTRNPLAGPGILGVNAGAAFAVVAAMAFLNVGVLTGYLWAAFAGAAVAAVFVYVLGSLGGGGPTPVKLALAGAAFSAMVGSATTAITLLDAGVLNDYRFWTVGSLTRPETGDLLAVAPAALVGVCLAVMVGRDLNAVALGEDMARSLGTRLVITRVLGAVSVVLLAGTATAIAGPIGFVGLVVPHIARALTGPDYRWIMAWCVLLAPTVLLLADVLGRVLIQPEQLQVGIVTGLIGAPFFIHLVRKRKVAQL
ncbi:FecCD family ABC transporter permease [Streptomonospora litoralis]|uniref:Putative siderophore transport system permease protein YfiZ n=1 Tax=Streptomonospora litoralis TaxID=2498135 RepID=A0A4P6Q684_9ACTN|nr:iron ABC transporter permease [Streptomonospora litoralis]QBI56225.1 putative siderophore transport system permease protein YfiZ precursor [Streptomonospora litoralis]